MEATLGGLPESVGAAVRISRLGGSKGTIGIIRRELDQAIRDEQEAVSLYAKLIEDITEVTYGSPQFQEEIHRIVGNVATIANEERAHMLTLSRLKSRLDMYI